MQITFVQTYPIYHDLITTSQWLERRDRDKWMPGILADRGHDVELWGVSDEPGLHEMDIEGMGAYTIRLFKNSSAGSKTKKHYSEELIKYARENPSDLYVLKGVDGGVGVQLIRGYLLPESKPFAFVIGGKYYTRYVPQAEIVFYETEEQKQHLMDPEWHFWRSPVEEEKLIRLPKSIDTDLFRPMPDERKQWDIITVGRLIDRYKNYEPLGPLSEHFNMAVVGGGPAEESLKAQYPRADFIGKVPHRQVPELLNRAGAFIHMGRNDYFPRVLVEAAACGCIPMAFADAIKEDVIPPETGLLLSRTNYIRGIHKLFQNPEKMKEISETTRKYAKKYHNKFSSRKPLNKMLDRLNKMMGRF